MPNDTPAVSKPLSLDLLIVRPGLHLVVMNPYNDYRDDPGAGSFLYEQHTCPTNWIDRVVAIIADGDDDPHGFAKYVRSIPAPEGMDEAGDIDDNCNTPWLDLFPELRGAKEATEPAEQTIASLRAELAGVREDAERYRWARVNRDAVKTLNEFRDRCDDGSVLDPEYTDAAIDAARSTKQGDGKDGR